MSSDLENILAGVGGVLMLLLVIHHTPVLDRRLENIRRRAAIYRDQAPQADHQVLDRQPGWSPLPRWLRD